MKLPKLPKYKSYKIVGAVKIAEIRRNLDGSAIITPVKNEGEPIIKPFTVDRHFMTKNEPKVGGYIVSYKDGYASFSPAKAFEEGYEKVEKKVKEKGTIDKLIDKVKDVASSKGVGAKEKE